MSDRLTPVLHNMVTTYAAWVRLLRGGTPAPQLPAQPDDPLAALGAELQLLSVAVARREQEMSKLLDLVQAAPHSMLLDDVLDEMYAWFTDVIPFRRIGCAFLSEDGSELTAYWARSDLGPVQVYRGYSQLMAGSSLEHVLRTAQPRIINDLPAYLAAKPKSDSTRRIVLEGGRASLTCPLIVDTRPIGFLFFTSPDTGAYHSSHQTIFRHIANLIASVIDKSRLYAKLVESNRMLVARSQQLEGAASRDALTGLLNRGAIDDVLQGNLDRHRRLSGACGIIFIDIDHFKELNDALGHAAGDAALREFARRISAAARATDSIGRYGGEEFLIVVEAVTGEQLICAAERLRHSISDVPFALPGGVRVVTASFGLAMPDPGGSTTADLMQRADEALYQAKQSGRNRCLLAPPRRLEPPRAPEGNPPA